MRRVLAVLVSGLVGSILAVGGDVIAPRNVSAKTTCTQILATYPNGVAKDARGAAAVVALGYPTPTIQAKVYAKARKLDRFKDGTACVFEADKRTPLPGLAAPAVTSTNDALVNGNAAVSASFATAFANAAGTCMVAMRDGKIIGEWYFAGRTPTTRSLAFSASKPLAAAAVGAAQQLGRLSIDQSIADFIPEFKGTKKAGITIRHLLTHTSGLQSSNIEVELALTTGTLAEQALKLPLVNVPGTTFDYNSSGVAMQLLARVIERAVGEKYATFVEKYVLRPAGMANSAYKGDVAATDWETGEPWLAGGLNTTCRDLARLGQVFHAKGRWADQQIFSADFAALATSVLMANVSTGGTPINYGLLIQHTMGGVGHVGACGQVMLTLPSRVTYAAMRSSSLRSSTEDPQSCIPQNVGTLLSAANTIANRL